VRAVVVGSKGQLGRELVAVLRGEIAWAGDRDEIDVTDEGAVRALLSHARPDVVFNATAWNRVDAAESEPAAAFAVNAFAPHFLARAARDAGALVVHYSTDYVFDGTAARPYREDDTPCPLGVYGASKLAGEHLVAAAGGEHLVVRTSGLLGRGGSEQKGGSFVERIVARARAGHYPTLDLSASYTNSKAPTSSSGSTGSMCGPLRATTRSRVMPCSRHAVAPSARFNTIGARRSTAITKRASGDSPLS